MSTPNTYEPVPAKDIALETASGALQDLSPVKGICAFLNAFHLYADEPHRAVEANHYCSHVTEDIRQCVIYDSPEKKARLIGVEYMITPKLYGTLDSEERRLWHSHVFEVKSGQLIMPRPTLTPQSVWEAAETKEMEEIIHLYGKTYHFWQVDRGDKLPLGSPKLMMSALSPGDIAEDLVRDRDRRFGEDHQHKKDTRNHIPGPRIHPDADTARAA